MTIQALEPREAGKALAALVLDGQGATPEAQQLGAYCEMLRRSGPGAALARVHPTWVAEALGDEADETVDAVLHSLPDALLRGVMTGLFKMSRSARALRPGGIKAEIEAIVADRWRRRAFANAGGTIPMDQLTASAELAWLYSAPPEEVELSAREIGIRGVARAFSGISREDLAKLCHGLPPGDSVRLVGAVVELCDTMKPDELRPLQTVHLKLLRAGGVSPALFVDTGLAMLAEALLAGRSERERYAIAYRLPEPMGRRLLDLSAPGVVLDAKAREVFAKELPMWFKELQAKGVAAHFGKAPEPPSAMPGMEEGRATGSWKRPAEGGSRDG